MIERRPTPTVDVGGVLIGSGHPIVVQSMTNTDTADADATAIQVAQLAGGQFAIVPQSNPQFFGTNLTVQAVISADRRFVRLSLAPFLTNLVPGPIQVFPIVVPVFTTSCQVSDQPNTGPVTAQTRMIAKARMKAIG